MSDARQQILDRIRRAKSGGSVAKYSDLPRNYIQHGSLDESARLHLMVERLQEYDADVVECAPEDLPACIADRLHSSGKRKFVAPRACPANG